MKQSKFFKTALLTLITASLSVGITQASVAMKDSLWKPGQRINVAFKNGTPEQKQTVIHAFKVWQRYANLDFRYYLPNINKNSPKELKKDTIRIRFTDEEGAGQSRVGTNINNTNFFGQNKSETKIGAGKDLKMLLHVSLHEIGHALGLKHTHQHPDSFEIIDEEERQKYCQSADISYSSNFKKLDPENTILGDYDVNSVMHYRFSMLGEEYEKYSNGNFTYIEGVKHYLVGSAKDGFLSMGDRKFIAQIYPYETPLTQEDIEHLSRDETKAYDKWYGEMLLGRTQANHCYIQAMNENNDFSEGNLINIYFIKGNEKFIVKRMNRGMADAVHWVNSNPFCHEDSIFDMSKNKCDVRVTNIGIAHRDIEITLNGEHLKSTYTTSLNSNKAQMLFEKAAYECFQELE